MTGGTSKVALTCPVLGPGGPNRRRPRAQREGKRIEQNRFAGARLASQNGESTAEIEIELSIKTISRIERETSMESRAPRGAIVRRGQCSLYLLWKEEKVANRRYNSALAAAR